MIRYTPIFLFVIIISWNCFAQYAPPAETVGSTAIKSDSNCIVSWATKCKIMRGHQDISAPIPFNPSSVGDSISAIGAEDGLIVSLGDGGSAILEFDRPITNGIGFDFVIFENGFDDRYLELAFVEVSSNGIDFYRFPSASLTDTNTQVGAFSYWADARQINNLAGKYRAGFGTPFDLQELNGISGLNIDSITHLKITDVVGSLLNEYCSRDASGRKINDPWPTPFASSGFDLDAVGVIHQKPAGIKDHEEKKIKVFPSFTSRNEPINIKGLNNDLNYEIRLFNSCGSLMTNNQIKHTSSYILNLDFNKVGIYFLQINSMHSSQLFKLVCID